MKQLYNLYSKIAEGAYQIGFLNEDMKDVVHSIKTYKHVNWVNTKGYDNGWFADPFIYDVKEDIIEVLAEELVYKENKGRISFLVINRKDYSLVDVQPILELENHLSFPYIIRQDDNIYVMPENNQSGSLKIYIVNPINHHLESPKVLVDEPLVDSQFFELNGKYYIFGIPYANDNFQNTKHVKVYVSDSFLGQYIYQSSIVSDLRDKRGAGSVFLQDGKLIRPTQLCEGGYGKGVCFYELKKGDDNCFVEDLIGQMLPDVWSRYPLQLHTYNEYKGLQIIDGYAYSKPVFRHILNCVKIVKHYI